jgi:hypothetical protein
MIHLLLASRQSVHTLQFRQHQWLSDRQDGVAKQKCSTNYVLVPLELSHQGSPCGHEQQDSWKKQLT